MANVSGNKKKFPVLTVLAFMLIIVLAWFSSYAPPTLNAAEDDEIDFTILHTNDAHGAMIPHSSAIDYHPERENPTIGGYARLADAVAEIREEKKKTGEPVLLFSGGDFIGGTAFSWLVPESYAPELSVKQEIGYDAVVIGNHEFDYGAANLADYLLKAGYPQAHEHTAVLGSNFRVPNDHLLQAQNLYLDNHLITLKNGLKVGIFGLMGKDAADVTYDHAPVEFTDQHEAAERMVAELEGQGAQVIVALTHSGVDEDLALARDVSGIDVIVGGHCHTALQEPLVENDTIIVQAGAHLEYLGQLELAYNSARGEVRIRNLESEASFLHRLDSSYKKDPEIDAAVAVYKERLNELVYERTDGEFRHILDPVMFSDFKIPDYPPLQESPFGNFVTDAMRLVAGDKTEHNPDFAIQANGAIRGSVVPGSMPHSMGQVSFYDLTELVGLGIGADNEAGYPLTAVYLTGDEILQLLEVAALIEEVMGNTYFLQFSGLRYEYNPQNAILFNIPFIDLPIPTTGAVVSAERYTGEGRQGFDDREYTAIKEGDQELYCLITDSYVVSFLPMVNELVPQLDVTLKDREGNPIGEEEIKEQILYVNGRELKVWQAVVEYAAGQPEGTAGLPEAESYYASTAGRINRVWTFPYIAWLVLALAILFIVIVAVILVIRRRGHRKKALNRIR